MDNTSRKNENLRNFKASAASSKANMGDAAHALIDEGKKRANELYDEGVSRLGEVEDQLRIYSDQLSTKIKQNPMSSILIAAGVGYILSKILK